MAGEQATVDSYVRNMRTAYTRNTNTVALKLGSDRLYLFGYHPPLLPCTLPNRMPAPASPRVRLTLSLPLAGPGRPVRLSHSLLHLLLSREHHYFSLSHLSPPQPPLRRRRRSSSWTDISSTSSWFNSGSRVERFALVLTVRSFLFLFHIIRIRRAKSRCFYLVP